jgi:hypothetical protein
MHWYGPLFLSFKLSKIQPVVAEIFYGGSSSFEAFVKFGMVA